jgi:hypothetical protein
MTTFNNKKPKQMGIANSDIKAGKSSIEELVLPTSKESFAIIQP